LEKRYLLRIDLELFEKLKKEAEKEDRSINQQINSILKKEMKTKWN
jgi:hypothetical protein